MVNPDRYWRAAVDEAGHHCYTISVSGRMISVTFDPDYFPANTGPLVAAVSEADPCSFSVTKDKVVYHAAGVAALQIMGCDRASDNELDDIQHLVRLLVDNSLRQGNSPTAAQQSADSGVNEAISLAHKELSKPNTNAALQRCADHFYQYRPTLRNEELMMLLKSFFEADCVPPTESDSTRDPATDPLEELPEDYGPIVELEDI